MGRRAPVCTVRIRVRNGLDCTRAEAALRSPPCSRAAMEHFLGGDFSGVRVHHGAHVTRLGALAYTQGDEIHFAPGEYRPGTTDGDRLLGHELVHVAQQRAGRVRAGGGEASVVDDAQLEAEANERAGLALAGEASTTA